MKSKRHTQPTMLIGSTDQELLERATSLPRFPAFDAYEINRATKSLGQGDPDGALASVLDRLEEAQLKRLATEFGFDATPEELQSKGFRALARWLFGTRRVALYSRRTNQNARTWDANADVFLLGNAWQLTKAGYSEREAIRKIAADPGKISKLPFRENRTLGMTMSRTKRETTLRRRYQKLKSQTIGLESLLCPPMNNVSAIDQMMYRALASRPPAQTSGENQTPR